MYRDPFVWYTRKQQFTSSIAASSISGYVLGIGDRHSQNILFDKKTGEIVHIDLGIAFDQGALLSTPETVPFRLTQNIINAMGICQVEGVFRKACEETMLVLRQNQESLFTLLDVFRYDPLHSWTVSPIKLLKTQRDENVDEADIDTIKENEKQHDEAAIALFGVKKKISNGISVACQVQELIQQATDPRNLCRMFPGWQPWV
jgi:ataxia telangiectasia mutated family protein